MLKKIIAAVVILVVVLGIGIGIANACPVVPTGPRVFCVNEPTRHHGRTINHIYCVSTAYSGSRSHQ